MMFQANVIVSCAWNKLPKGHHEAQKITNRLNSTIFAMKSGIVLWRSFSDNQATRRSI